MLEEIMELVHEINSRQEAFRQKRVLCCAGVPFK